MNFGDAGEGFGLLDTEMDDYIQYSLMAGLGNGIGWIFAPLGFGDWQANRQRPSPASWRRRTSSPPSAS